MSHIQFVLFVYYRSYIEKYLAAAADPQKLLQTFFAARKDAAYWKRLTPAATDNYYVR